MYIALEGVDGAGKSTQIEALRAIYSDALFTFEPGNTELGSKIRELVLHHKMSQKARLFLFLADRAEHFETLISANRDRLIISDRTMISGLAYAFDSGDIELLITMNSFALEGFLPDAVVLLEMDEKTINSRLDHDKLDEIEKQGTKKLLTIQENIKKATKLLNIKLLTIDASLEAEKITQKIKDFIDDNRS